MLEIKLLKACIEMQMFNNTGDRKMTALCTCFSSIIHRDVALNYL